VGSGARERIDDGFFAAAVGDDDARFTTLTESGQSQ
jgi:hypothetical protein